MTRSSSKLTAVVAGLAATLLTLTSTSAQGMLSSSKRSLSTEQRAVEIVENHYPISNNNQNTRGEEESDVNNSVSSFSSTSSSENESYSSSSSSESSEAETKKRRLLHYLRIRLISKSLFGNKQDDDIPTGIQYTNNDGHWWLSNVEDEI